MRKAVLIVMLLIAVVISGQAQESKPATKTPSKTQTKPQPKKSDGLSTPKEKMSYVVGYDIGLKLVADIQNKNLNLNVDALLRGMQDAFKKKEAALPPEEVQSAMEEFQRQLKGQQVENERKLRELVEKYKKEGEEFLAVNATKDSVKVTASGLQYKIVREGTGKSPADSSTVTVHYRGRLLSGVVFDESYARGEPATFRLDQVIKGWTEGVQLMKEGAKFEFYIPNNLAYGERPAGQLIPPGSALIFEVELLEVK